MRLESVTWNRVDASSVYLKTLQICFILEYFPSKLWNIFNKHRYANWWRRAADLGFVLLIPTQPYLNKSRRVKLFKISQMSPMAVWQHKTTMAINVRALITFFNGPPPNKERNGNQIPSASPVPSQPLLFSFVFSLWFVLVHCLRPIITESEYYFLLPRSVGVYSVWSGVAGCGLIGLLSFVRH